MCVIAYKHENVKFMSESNIEDMWNTNPDGAGVMWRDRATNEIRYIKGFMKLKSLKKWIDKNRDWLDGVECAVHFRITTHGGTCAGNCHPFVVGGNPHSLEGSAKRVLMHNGILPLTPREKTISDSAELALRLGEFDDPISTLASFNECLKGNRIIIMDESGTHFFGDEFKKSSVKGCEGILYSNLNWEPFEHFQFSSPTLSSRSYGTFACHYFDKKSGVFRESFSGKKVDFEDVDPDSLTEADYDVWLEKCDDKYKESASSYGISAHEYRDLEIEAESCGMCVDDYISMLTEDESYASACSD